MEFIKLTPRLQKAADFVRDNARVADIGTDHGYLCVYLLQTKKAKYALACDINDGPLSSAAAAAQKNNLTSSMEIRLSNGLEKISENEVDDIVIAGMGGELIAKLLNTYPWVENKRLNFVLQPMSRSECLREYLIRNGFAIKEEQIVAEGNKLYVVMRAVYSDNVMEYPEYYKYIGEIDDFHCQSNVLFLQKQIDCLNKKTLGDRSGRLKAVIKELEKLL